MNKIILSFLIASISLACDPCSIYTASKLQGFTPGQTSIFLSEQFTDFKSMLPDNSIKTGELAKAYSVTQLGIGYDLNEKSSVQISIPLIGRTYDSYSNFRANSDSEFGLGDISLSANYAPISISKNGYNLTWIANTGIKLPTGDTGSLSESINANSKVFKHHPISSASGGRVLSLGTGSYDFIVGSGIIGRKDNYLLMTNFQYTFRTEGDFDYQFANDFIWDFGPGYYLLTEHNNTLALRAALSGEKKGLDQKDDKHVSGSKIDNLYLGPQILFTLSDNISGDLGFDFRISGNEADSAVLPEYRVRTGIAYKF